MSEQIDGVWMVESGSHDDYQVNGPFRSEADALRWILQQSNAYECNAPAIWPFHEVPERVTYWGTAYMTTEDAALYLGPAPDWHAKEIASFHVHYVDPLRRRQAWSTDQWEIPLTIEAASFDEAKQLAKDWITRVKANEQPFPCAAGMCFWNDGDIPQPTMEDDE